MVDKAYNKLTAEDFAVENDGTFEMEPISVIPQIGLQRRDRVNLPDISIKRDASDIDMLKNVSSEHHKEGQSNVGEDMDPLNRSDGNLANPLLKEDTNDDKR
ncbi:hypothetical protein ACF0H5_016370 [Mactra antiquata]